MDMRQDSAAELPAADLHDDQKAPGAFRTIGEVSKALSIRPHVLRYWEEQFPMLSPVKRAGGRRYYRPEDVELVATIDRLVHREGYTLRGARLFLQASTKKARKATVVEATSPAPAERPAIVAAALSDSDILHDLQRLRGQLVAALAI